MNVNGVSFRNFQKDYSLKVNVNKSNFKNCTQCLNNNTSATKPVYPSNNYFYLNNLSFTRNLTNAKDAHLDYLGANVAKDGKVVFRVYSTKEKIELQIASNDHDLKYWQAIEPDEEEKISLKTYPMKKVEGSNVFEVTPDVKIPQGTLYRFKITDKDGNVSYAKDPRTYYQPHDAMGWSSVYNHHSYVWNDDDWRKGLNERRLKHISDKSSWGAPNGMIISEKHIGLLGGYEKAKEEVDKVVQDGICNTIYLLPLGEFYGDYNHGYDEVDKFAPESSYGTPDELKSLVDYAHSKGINVILDVVPNHFGCIGAVCQQFAPSLDDMRQTGWGAALRFNGEDSEYMRNFMCDMMMNWLVNFHFDGLRIDATEKLESDPSLKYFAAEIRNHPETKDAVLIPEHLEKTRKLAQPLNEDETLDPLKTFKEASIEDLEADRLGYDMQYIYDFKNTLIALALGMQVYDCPPLIDDFVVEYQQGNRFYDELSAHLEDLKANNSYIYYNMHDEYNVFGGVRPVVRALARSLNLAKEDAITTPDGLDKSGYHKAEQMLEDYLNGDYNNITKEGITIEQFEKSYFIAQAKNRLMLAATFMHPGVKGFSMGDERGELTPLRYFAQYDNKGIEEAVTEQKGYDIGQNAFEKSSKLYNEVKDEEFSKSVTQLSKDFVKLIEENPALRCGDYDKTTAVSIGTDSILIQRWNDKGDDVFAIANFSQYSETYKNIVNFPEGTWAEVLNTDDKKYNGTGEINNKNKLIKKGDEIKLAPNSLVVFKSV